MDRTGFKAGALENGLRTRQGRADPDLRRRLPAPARHARADGRPLRRPEGGGGAVPLGAPQPRLLGADRGAGAAAGRPLRHGARRPRLVGPLLQLQRHRRHVAAVGHRRGGRLAARHADRGHGSVLPGAAAAAGSSSTCPRSPRPAELPVEMSAFKAQQFRWAKGSIQVAKKLLPRILRSNATWASEVRGVLPPDQQLRLPAAAAAVAAAAAQPGAAHRARRARGVDDRPAAVLRHHHEPGGVLPGHAEGDRAAASSPARSPASRGGALARLPLVLSLGIGLCVNQTRAVLRGGVRQGHRVRAHAQARHPRQAGVLEQQEVPGGPLDHPAASSWRWPATSSPPWWWRSGTATTSRCRSWRCSCVGFGYVGGASLWQGSIGQALRGVFSRRPVVAGGPSTFEPVPAVDRMMGAAPTAMSLDDLPTMEMVTGDRPRSGLPA